MGMKRTMALVVGLALLAAACGPDGAADPSSEYLPAEPVDGSVVEVPAPSQPGPRDASPDPITEPVFKPAPEPGPEPSPKPVRSDLPTPPPTRRRPPNVVSEPIVPRVPPSQDLRPGGVIVEDDARVLAAVSDLAGRLDQEFRQPSTCSTPATSPGATARLAVPPPAWPTRTRSFPDSSSCSEAAIRATATTQPAT